MNTENIVNAEVDKVVEILHQLRTIDLDMLDHTITLSQLAEPILPPAINKAMKVIVQDINLVKIFAEQARAYNTTSQIEGTMKEVFEMFMKGGEKK